MNAPGVEVGEAIARAAGDAIAPLWEHDEEPELLAVTVTVVVLRDDSSAVHISTGTWVP